MKKNDLILPIKIRKFITVLLMTLAFMDVSSEAFASHLVGGQITYTWVSNNTYRLRYTLYRDCSGISAPSSVVLTTFPATANVTLNRISFSDVSLLCPGQVSICRGGTVAGIEEHIYEGTTTLGAGIIYTLAVSQNARTGIITTLTNPGSQSMYLTAILNTNYAGNSSPQFLNRPIAQFCTNQPASISPNGSDTNGDVILYSLTNALRAAGTPVVYAPGFNGLNPLTSSTGISINPNTGQLSFTPSTVEIAVVTIKAEEFRGGIKIGEVNRDVMIKMVNCGANTAPVIAPLPNVIVPVGNTYCVNVNVSDNVSQTISLTAVSSIIPPATFSITSAGAGFTNGSFCFTPTAANTGNTYTVTVNAQDNYCPTPGTASRSFNITVPAACNVSLNSSSTPAACGVSNGTATASLTGGTSPFVYSWTGPGGFTSIQQSISGLAPGTYCINITDAFNCASSGCVTVGGGTAFPITASIVNTVCGSNNGSITISASTGVAPYTFQLNGGTVQNSGLFSNLSVGAYTVIARDAAGCSKTEIFNVAAESDVTPPNAICKSATVFLNGLGDGILTVSMVNDGSTDNCSISSLSLSKTSFNCSDVGTQNVTLTVTDASNNSSTCVASVIVIDNLAPDYVDCQNTTLSLDLNGIVTLTPEQITDVAEIYAHEACGIASITLSKTNFNCSNIGGNTVTLTVTDVNNNVSTCSSTVTVVDNISPTIVCPASITVQCASAVPVPDPSSVTASDNCSAIVTFVSDVISNQTCANRFTIIRTYKATDASNNFATCTQIITVNDNTAPVLNTLPANTTVSCNAIPGAATLTATDNCDANPSVILSVISTQNANTTNAGYYNYTITRTWTATDNCNNSSSHIQTITVQDITAPVITCPASVTVNCQDNNTSASTGVATGTDNCSPVAITQTQTSTQNTSPANAGYYNYVITRTWRATDVAGNFSICVQTITVQDVTAPVVTCPTSVTVNCQDNNTSASTGVATGTDNCSPVAITQTQTSTQNADVNNAGHYNYVITRTWTATDVSNNATNCVQTITVQDVTAPVVTCPASVTINCQANNTSASTGVATGTDNCSPATITQTQTSTQNANANNAGYYNYVITRTWRATDVAGNFSICVQTITVQDVTAPTFTAPANITIYTNAACGYNATVLATGDVTNEADNCATGLDATFTDLNVAGACAGSRVITRTWSLVDYSGNAATQQVQTITVSDNIVPVITVCPTNKSVVPNNAGCAYKVIGTSWNATATDNCSIPVIKYTLGGATVSASNAFTSLMDVVFNSGVTTVTAKAYDACNNVSTGCTFTVTVATTLNAVSTTPNRQMYFGLSADQFSTITTAPTGGTAPYTVVYTMNRPLKCNVTVAGGNETWVASGGISTGNVCPASGSTLTAVVSTSGPISAGSSYAITIKFMANAIINATVTDAFGCVVSDTTQIWGEDVRCFAGNSTNVKVKICHRNNGNGCVSICVDESAVQTHLDHGDFLGSCTPGCIAPPTYRGVVPEEAVVNPIVAEDDFNVQVSPNPTRDIFKIKVGSKTNEKVTIRIYDVTGKTITLINNITKGFISTIGNELKGGTYFAEVTQGTNRKVIKLIKF